MVANPDTAARHSSSSPGTTQGETPEYQLEPIRTEQKATRQQTRGSARPGTPLSRTRSQNGYGCDDEIGSDVSADAGERGRETPEQDPFEVVWDGGDSDPLNPRSYSTPRKWMITLIVVSGSFCVTCTSSIYTSTYAQMEAAFGVSRIIATLGLSTFVLGLGFGPMLFSPLSEFYGRRPIYLVSWSIFLIWIIPSAVAPNIATMIVSRFFDGFAGSTFLAVSGGTVGDLFAKEHLQVPMAIFTVAPLVGPTVGPLLGGLINYNVNWRWTYYVLLIWVSVVLLCIILLVPETYHPVLLRRKAAKIRKETGDDRWVSASEKVEKSIIGAIVHSLKRPFLLLWFEPMCLNLCIFTALLLGIMYLFFGAFPLVFGTNHGFNLWQVGLTFLGLGVGSVASLATDPLWYRLRGRLVAKLEQETGVAGASEPEFRLLPALAGGVLVPVGLFIFGWSTFPWVHWIVPIIGSALFGAGTILVFTGVFTFLVDAYPLYAASALAANSFVRGTFAAATPLFGNQMYNALGYQWATSLLAFLTLVMTPFPFIFFYYGKRIRQGSRFAKR